MTRTPDSRSANERLKDSFQSTMAVGLVFATFVHVSAFALFPELSAPDWMTAAADEVTVVRMDEILIPAAPPLLQRPAAPVGAVDVPVEATLTPFDFYEVSELPPPPAAPQTVARGERSAFKVYTIGPILLDPEDFQRALMRAYPRELRDAGVGGRVELLLGIDENGRVISAGIGSSSGYTRLDETALALSDLMRFRPAVNRDQKVPVLVSIPVEFRVRD